VIWYLIDPARLMAERSAIEALAANVDWLTELQWSIDHQTRLVLRFTISLGDRRYQFVMTYPEFFPATPPGVRPLDAEHRISPHQYGVGGDLCLEYRPDNWEPRFTGRDLIESAHRLISIEQPVAGEPRQVRSAHFVTQGQELRAKRGRLLVTADLRDFMRMQPESTPFRCEVRTFFQHSGMSAVVNKVTLPDGATWKSLDIPKIGSLYRGILVRVSTTDLQGLVEEGTGARARQLRNALAEVVSPPLTAYEDREFIIATDGADIRLFWQLAASSDDIIQFATLDIDDDKPRLPAGYEMLAGKRVTVVGCGSVGSKMATSLARSGARYFLLVDDDVFIRKNLVRNDLDWRNMGEHKAEGLAARIRRISPATVAKVKCFRLGGQEAAGSASSLLSEIGGSDLIIDATADSRVFNLLSAVATGSKKPMVWCEVFAGGIGGFVARYRPGIDHPPQTMRAILRSWFRDQGVPWSGGAAIDYGGEDSTGAPLVADDGDVSVVAAYATRMAVDLLLGGVGFPHSMYVVSLKEGWIFEQPFEAYPVHGTQPPVAEPVSAASEQDWAEAAQFISHLIRAKADEAPSAPQN